VSLPVSLSTERLLLRSPRPDDAERLCAYYVRNRHHLAPWDPPAPPGFHEPASWPERVASYERDRLAGISLRLVLASSRHPDGPVIGVASLTQIVRGPFLCASLGYSIDAREEGKGYMHEALGAVVAHAFGPLGLHRVQANYLPVNERSGRLLRRLGFVVEGYARDYLFIDGAFRDHVLTSLTNSDPSLVWAPVRG
jgi:ribosomal-protein-alanine N-acetyltransferase